MLRRALLVGAAVATVLVVMFSAGVVVVGGGGALGLAAVVTALTVGILTSSGWLLLSLVVDLLADRVPATRRLWWAIGLGVVGFVGPVFILGALSAAVG